MQTIRDLGEYTFPALFKNSILKFAERNALSLVNGTPLTYRELESRTEKTARLLYSLGVRKGDRVAIYSTSDPNWGAAYFSIVNYGAVAVPLLPDFNSHEVETILTHAAVSGIFVADKMYSRLADFDEKMLPFIISVEKLEMLRGAPPETLPDCMPPVEVTEQDTASIIYTSGTTGRSKGVELTHKNLVWTAVQCQTIYRVHKRDRCLSFLPLSHVYEFTIGFVMQILNGSCIYYLGRPPTVSALLPAFKKIRPTIVCSVPMIVEKIYKNKVMPMFNKTPLIKRLYDIRFFQKIFHRIAGHQLNKTFGGQVHFFGIGGAKVDPMVERFMKDGKFKYAIGYGLTETSPLLAGSAPKQTVPGTVGPVLRGVELAVANPDPETGIGEIVARGENIMKGYYKDPALTAAAFTTENDSCGAGWFRTGDLGILHNGIWLALKGRLKNMILGASGENIYPEDIEFILNQHPLVQESLVVEGEKGLVAMVQLAKDFAEDVMYKREEILSEIQYFVNEQVNRISKIGEVKSVREFEKTASQKIKRYLYNLKNKSSNKPQK